MSRYHAHRDERDDWPVVTADDFRAVLWLIVFAFLFVAICAVAPS